jgi:hypothetical protein
MPISAAATATAINSTLLSYAQVSVMSASPNSITGCSQSSSLCCQLLGMIPNDGNLMIPPTSDRPARATRGIHMIGDDSCGLNSPWALWV